MANRKLKEDLQHVNNHCHELTAVSKEVLKRKGTTDRHCTELEKTVENLQQENEDLQRKIADMEKKQKREKKKSKMLDGIALLAEVAKKL